MSRIPNEAIALPARDAGAPADLSGGVVGSGLALDRTPAGDFVVHAVTPSGTQKLGSFARVEDAWKAIDAYELEA